MIFEELYLILLSGSEYRLTSLAENKSISRQSSE